MLIVINIIFNVMLTGGYNLHLSENTHMISTSFSCLHQVMY